MEVEREVSKITEMQEQVVAIDSPFSLDGDDCYQQWRKHKLTDRRPDVSALLVKIADPYKLSTQEKQLILENCDRYNMSVYQLENSDMHDKALVHAIAEQFSMRRLDKNLRSDEDSVSSVEVREQAGNQYIPYTNKALSWHTDGYYNLLDKQIYGFILHCVSPSNEGGINSLVNPESIYIALRDENKKFIEALMHPQAMTIPENIENGKVIRKAQTGPVFMLKANGRLHMRFSARKRNIIWRDTEETNAAVEMLNQLMADEKNSVQLKLKAGQGLICNNVLHNRSCFTDTEKLKRLMYRARFYDAVG